MEKPFSPRAKSEELDKRIEELEKEFTSSAGLARSGWYYLGGLLGVPLIVFLGLFLFRPFFVVTRKKEGVVRDRRKLVRWTLVATFAAYGAAYCYACYRSAPAGSFSPHVLV